MKRVFIVHGWGGYPEEGWFPWLKKELEAKGFKVLIPSMPNPLIPTMEEWIPYLAKAVGEPDEQTYLVGHSIGCPTIIHYLATLPQGARVGGAVFVAPWFMLKNLESEEEENIAAPWITTPVDFEKVKAVTSRFTAIFSDDDPFVSYDDNAPLFQEKLGAKVVLERGKQHLNGEAGVIELPSARDALFEIAAV